MKADELLWLGLAVSFVLLSLVVPFIPATPAGDRACRLMATFIVTGAVWASLASLARIGKP